MQAGADSPHRSPLLLIGVSLCFLVPGLVGYHLITPQDDARTRARDEIVRCLQQRSPPVSRSGKRDDPVPSCENMQDSYFKRFGSFP
jgi:hypothetical protein